MKKTFQIISLFVVVLNTQSSFVKAQNLVPNPSFEDYSICPDNISGIGDDQISRALGWSTYSETSDYFHSCGQIWNVGVPNNQPGYQFAHTGNAYAGLVTWDTLDQNYREALGRQLSSSLFIGQKYYVSFFVNLGGKQGACKATNKIGAKFSTVPYSYSNPIPINNMAHIYSDSIISDTINWTFIFKSFIADSTYQYIAIGNFFDSTNTNILTTCTFPFSGYYFVDDICVSTDSVFAWTNGMQNTSSNNNISVYLNPFLDECIITFTDIQNEILIDIFSVDGKKLKELAFYNTSDIRISNENFSSGIYLLKITANRSTFFKKIIKH